MQMIIGKKLGMTRIFDKNNKSVGVTLVSAQPNIVICKKTKDKDGYDAIQIGYGNKKNINKPLKNHIKKSKLKTVKIIREIKLEEDKLDKYNIGDSITVADFKNEQNVDVVGTSKGKGFAGVMKRHGFSGMPASHGHEKQRIPGSIGGCYPQRVVKGKKMAGHMGNERNTVKNTKIIDVDEENNIIAVKGSVPGSNNNIVQIIAK